jgi:hypothetical protein
MPPDVLAAPVRVLVVSAVVEVFGHGASLGGAQSNVFNPSLGFFLYHILHTMSL